MKRFLLLLSLTFIQTASVIAFDINFGLKGGLNVSYLYGSYIYMIDDIPLHFNPKLSERLSLGGFIRYNFSGMTSIQSEILYTTRGCHYLEIFEFRNQSLELDGELTLSYIEIPIVIRFSTSLPDRGPTFVQEPGFTFNVYTGASFSYKTNAILTGKISGDVLGGDFNERFRNRIWNQFTDNDLSIIAGAGFEYGVRYRFIFDIRYAIGLLNIGKDPQFPDDIRYGMVTVFIGTVL
jgi:hypothetical protein